MYFLDFGKYWFNLGFQSIFRCYFDRLLKFGFRLVIYWNEKFFIYFIQ